MAKGAPVPGGGWWSWGQSVILGSTCSQFKLMGHQSSLIIYCQLFCNIHDSMCFLIHYETLDRMWVVRTALLQWRHHHWPLLVEVPENLRKWKDGENIISIIITIIKLFVANPQKLRKCQFAVMYQEPSIYISLRFVLTIKKTRFHNLFCYFRLFMAALGKKLQLIQDFGYRILNICRINLCCFSMLIFIQ